MNNNVTNHAALIVAPAKAKNRQRRKKAVILVGDAVGYSAMMEQNESRTHAEFLNCTNSVFRPHVLSFGGKFIKTTGDGFLAIFQGATSAVDCAFACQTTLELKSSRKYSARLRFRLAVTTASIIVEADDVYGTGVNLAARLQAFAEPGGLVATDLVIRELPLNLASRFIDIGQIYLRSLAKPVNLYASRTATASAAGTRSSTSLPSIAVLGFQHASDDIDSRHLATGFTDATLSALTPHKDIFVVSGGVGLTDEAVSDPRGTAARLDVRYMLTGRITREGKRLRVSVTLIEGETAKIIYAGSHDGTLENLISLQDKIALSVTRLIAPNLRQEELARALPKKAETATPYDLFLRAQNLIFRMDRRSFEEARGLLQMSISLDPSYGQSHAYIAYWYILRVGEFNSPDPTSDGAAAAYHAEKAIQVDPANPTALALHGHIQSYLFRRYDAAMDFLRHATEVGPNVALAWTMRSTTEGFLEMGADALAHAKLSLAHSPRDHHLFWHETVLSQAYFVTRDYDSAALLAVRALARNARSRAAYRCLITSLANAGRIPEAHRAAEDYRKLQPDFDLSAYVARCPFKGRTGELWVAGLSHTGLLS